MSAPHTPIRAIPSTLLSRTAPTIPPAAQAYEPLVKRVLRHRQYKIFLRAGLFSWFLVATWAVSRAGGVESLLMPIHPSTWAYAAATFALGALPVVVLRKTYLAVAPTPATSPSKTFSGALQKTSTIHTLMTYTASSISLAVIHILVTNAYDATVEPHARLSLFVKSRKHPYYLNGHLIYVLLSQAFVAFACLIRCVLLDRFAVRWTSSPSTNGGEQLKTFGLARVVTVALTTLIYTLFATAAYLVFFAVVRSAAFPLVYQIPGVNMVLRPFTAHFLRGQWTPLLFTRHWPLVTRAFYLALSTIGIWEFAESSFDSIVAQPVPVAAQTADAGLTLVSGITSADGYLQHFAYAELRDFAVENSPAASARRTALFGDQKYSPSAWATLVRAALVLLGRDYQLFLRRGQPAPPAPAAPATSTPTAKPTTPPLPAPATPLLRTSVFKPAPASPLRAALDTFASDGPLAAAVSETAEAGASHINMHVHVPELFRSVLGSPATPVPVANKEKEKTKENAGPAVAVGKWGGEVGKYVPHSLGTLAGRVGKWWTRERVHRVAEASLPNRHVDALAVEVLCRLACASLTEDRYGVVQRDIPRIVEALLAFLDALEDFQTELNAKYALPPAADALQSLPPTEAREKETLAMEAARASEVASAVGDAIKDGMVQIVRTFGEKLAAFKFPPRTARKLQGFVDYN